MSTEIETYIFDAVAILAVTIPALDSWRASRRKQTAKRKRVIAILNDSPQRKLGRALTRYLVTVNHSYLQYTIRTNRQYTLVLLPAVALLVVIAYQAISAAG